jgi:FHS family L-fucose permease-like MFS transporter
MKPMVLVTSLFFLWGLANNLNDILVKQFTKAFDLSDFRAGLVMTAVNFGYFVAALPAGFLTKQHSYKRTILVGLTLYSFGALLFVPASMWRMYSLFLFSLLIIGCGLACLETAANPFVSVLGPPESATQRLNFAQAFNPLGSIAGVLIGRNVIFDGRERDLRSCSRVCEEMRAGAVSTRQQGTELACSGSLDRCAGTEGTHAQEVLGCWLQSSAGTVWPAFEPVCSSEEVVIFEESAAMAVQRPYLLIAVTVGIVALFVIVTPFPSPGRELDSSAAPGVASDSTSDGTGVAGGGLLLPTLRRLRSHAGWREGAVAQFLYVGAQIGVWSFLIRYVQHNLPGTSEQDAADYLFASLVCMVLGRFASVSLLRWAASSGRGGPRSTLTGVQLMEVYACLNCFLCFVAVVLGGTVGVKALVAVSFFMSIMYLVQTIQLCCSLLVAEPIRKGEPYSSYGSSRCCMCFACPSAK